MTSQMPTPATPSDGPSEIESLRTRVARLEDQVAALCAQRTPNPDNGDGGSTSQATAAGLHARLFRTDDKQSSLTALLSYIEMLQSSIDSQRVVLAEFKQAVNAFNDSKEPTLQALYAEQTSLSRGQRALRADIELLKQRRGPSDARGAADVAESSPTSQDVAARLTELEDQFSALNNRVDELSTDLLPLAQRSKARTAQLETAETGWRTVTGKLEDLERRTQAHASDLISLDARLDSEVKAWKGHLTIALNVITQGGAPRSGAMAPPPPPARRAPGSGGPTPGR